MTTNGLQLALNQTTKSLNNILEIASKDGNLKIIEEIKSISNSMVAIINNYKEECRAHDETIKNQSELRKIYMKFSLDIVKLFQSIILSFDICEKEKEIINNRADNLTANITLMFNNILS